MLLSMPDLRIILGAAFDLFVVQVCNVLAYAEYNVC